MFVFYWDYLPLHHSWSDLVHCAHMDRCLAGFLAVSENLDRLAKGHKSQIGQKKMFQTKMISILF